MNAADIVREVEEFVADWDIKSMRDDWRGIRVTTYDGRSRTWIPDASTDRYEASTRIYAMVTA